MEGYALASDGDLRAKILAAGTTGAPMSYLWNGKQYIVVAIGGEDHPAELPEARRTGRGRIYPLRLPRLGKMM